MKAVNGLICDGGYMKLLQEDSAKDLAKFDNDTRYTIMFGPDRCGSTDKVTCVVMSPEARSYGMIPSIEFTYHTGSFYPSTSKPNQQKVGGKGALVES